ncbi:MAG: GNAT family N-acetyltransferase [Firmicutes bacterium]|nr:GNAT family N-acetyltransferase [Bacillota bacterium]
MEIRKAQLGDFEIVRSITQTTIRSVYPKYYPAGAVEFFSEHHSDERILRDIEAGIVYLLTEEGTCAGTVTVAGNEINRLFVLPEMQHKGFGQALLNFAEEKISASFDTIRMDASLPAKKIYLLRGYKETEYHIIPTGNGDYLCYDVMEKTVDKTM